MELIDKQDAIKAIDDVLMEDEQYKVWLKLGINNLKPVDAQPVRHGKWIGKSTGGEYFDCCSECGYVEFDAPNNYCPRCGAKMRGETE